MFVQNDRHVCLPQQQRQQQWLTSLLSVCLSTERFVDKRQADYKDNNLRQDQSIADRLGIVNGE